MIDKDKSQDELRCSVKNYQKTTGPVGEKDWDALTAQGEAKVVKRLIELELVQNSSAAEC